MEINLEEIEITHNENERRFEVLINGLLSKLDYLQDEDTLDLLQKSVSEQF
jgi:hypothetical protein